MDLTVGVVVVAVLATFVGAMIQGAVGFGMNLVTVPALVLTVPESLPVAVIVLALPISIAMVARERHSVDRAGVGWILTGRLPGTVVGAWIVAAVSTRSLQALIGVVVLALVVASVKMPPVPVRATTEVTAGVVSGVTGTAAGIGGPPLALLYQRRDGPTIRSTLAATFLVGTLLSMTALAVAGQVHRGPFFLGVGLAPAVVIGLVAGRRFHDLLDRGWLRPAVLAFAAASAVSAIISALV